MTLTKQNPSWRAGASRNQLVGWLHHFPTASESQAQMLAGRFRLSPWLAGDIARLCYGKPAND